jgi:hypothetical protein
MLKKFALLLCVLFLSIGVCRADQASALAKLNAADDDEVDALARNILADGYESDLEDDFDDADTWYSSYGDTGPFAPNYDVVDVLYDETDGAEYYLGQVSSYQDGVHYYQDTGSSYLDSGWYWYEEEEWSYAEEDADDAITNFANNGIALTNLLIPRGYALTRIAIAEADMAEVEGVEMDADSARNDMDIKKSYASGQVATAESDLHTVWYTDYSDAGLRYWTEIEPVYGPDQTTEDLLDDAYEDIILADDFVYTYADAHWDDGVYDDNASDIAYGLGENATTTSLKCEKFGDADTAADAAYVHYDDCAFDAETSQSYSCDAHLHCDAAHDRMDVIEGP